jgi:hypothetical protein
LGSRLICVSINLKSRLRDSVKTTCDQFTQMCSCIPNHMFLPLRDANFLDRRAPRGSNCNPNHAFSPFKDANFLDRRAPRGLNCIPNRAFSPFRDANFLDRRAPHGANCIPNHAFSPFGDANFLEKRVYVVAFRFALISMHANTQ